MAKLGFILLVVLFGSLMFIAGTLAPAGIGQGLNQAAEQVMAALPWRKAEQKLEAGVAKGAPAHLAPPAVAVGASKATPLAASSLLIPIVPPAGSTYGLQAGQFLVAGEADTLASSIKAARLPAQQIANVQDQGGTLWTVVAVGPYGSLDDVNAANAAVAAQLGLPGPLPVLLLPASPAKS
ncbi:hypothetical protein Hrubri_2326 [Herbaspirillum rubrisubalbicans M1]|uniref:SPOR domain-containing protein n=1 Tax=Herbaspirillum rubrisubalbicans TaxID=80842 RepID=UPI000739FF75|nr:SPOR domain-containing protein [Herbaspirillum rubrisubalbicans]ALU89511.1 hypothetical protein Hrubri_2326 [Herbaspirillum rubrisubalbicans M1]